MIYQIITHKNLPAFQELVNEALRQDWIPAGGMLTYLDHDEDKMLDQCFAQALIKYGETDPPATASGGGSKT